MFCFILLKKRVICGAAQELLVCKLKYLFYILNLDFVQIFQVISALIYISLRKSKEYFKIYSITHTQKLKL